MYVRFIGAAAVLVAAGALGGCGKGVTSKRPLLASSATEAVTIGSTDGGSSDLDFFDALAARDLVCHDDVLHGALLLGNGESAATYADRKALAKQLGYVDLNFARPALEASTLGEVSKVMLRVSEGSATAGSYNQEQALLKLAGRGLMPVQAQPYQGMTGAQFVTVLAGVREGMDDRPRPPVRLTQAEQIPAATPVVEPVPEPARGPSSDASAIASAEGGAGIAGEPIPSSALDRSIEKPAMAPVVDVVEPQPEAASAAPAAEAPAASPPPPPPPPSKPRVWVSGTPLRKP